MAAPLKWGDVDDDDNKQEITLSSKPDQNGIKTIVEFVTNEAGKKVKVTRQIKVVTKTVRANKNVLARRQWAKFGDCEGVAPGPEKNITYASYEIIHLDLRPRKERAAADDQAAAANDPLSKLADKDSIVVCRNCGETGHWTLKCPKRNNILPVGMAPPPEDDVRSPSLGGGAAAAAAKSGKYVPLHLREGARARPGGGPSDRFGDRENEATLRVTNLSEDTTESDLAELFRPFGHTTRIYLAKDRQTNLSRGFAYVSYASHESAEAAMRKLNGYGYDNLILHVEWGKKREEVADKDKPVA